MSIRVFGTIIVDDIAFFRFLVSLIQVIILPPSPPLSLHHIPSHSDNSRAQRATLREHGGGDVNVPLSARHALVPNSRLNGLAVALDARRLGAHWRGVGVRVCPVHVLGNGHHEVLLRVRLAAGPHAWRVVGHLAGLRAPLNEDLDCGVVGIAIL